MSDIHGCYDDMIKMLEQIAFTDEDTLILAGDYIDRGSQSFEMLKWIESNPKNVIFLRGNHDEEFAYLLFFPKDQRVLALLLSYIFFLEQAGK